MPGVCSGLYMCTLSAEPPVEAGYTTVHSSAGVAVLCAMQAFVQKLAVCLLDVDKDPNSPMMDQMHNWTAEATCFVSFLPCYRLSSQSP